MVSPLLLGLGGAGLGALGGLLGERSARRARRRQRAAIQQAREFADETVRGITEGELFSSANEFLTSSFRDAADSPLARDFAKSIRQAQAVRGTFAGNIGAAQEAVGRSGFAQQLRQSLLPQALSFAQAPELLRQRILASEAPLRVAAATGAQIFGAPNLVSPGASMIGQGIQGGAAGFKLGQVFQGQSQQAPAPDFDEEEMLAAGAALGLPAGTSAAQLKQLFKILRGGA